MSNGAVRFLLRFPLEQGIIMLEMGVAWHERRSVPRGTGFCDSPFAAKIRRAGGTAVRVLGKAPSLSEDRPNTQA